MNILSIGIKILKEGFKIGFYRAVVSERYRGIIVDIEKKWIEKIYYDINEVKVEVGRF